MKKKLMIIDDEPDTIELVKAIMEFEDEFEAKTYTDSRDAIKALKTYKDLPDLIILDVRMPYLSGLDFCKMIREDEKLKNLKIVFFTASSDSDKSLLKKYNVLGYIFKPFDNEMLIKDIKKYLKA